jgi:formylglycine-generating enzyme required for sulfatase activity
MNDGSGAGCGKGSATWPVGSKPKGASPYGVLDMAGNVWKWVTDWYDEAYYANSPSKNPPGPSSGQVRVLRGGSFGNGAMDVRGAYRARLVPGVWGTYWGFRCAQSVWP